MGKLLVVAFIFFTVSLSIFQESQTKYYKQLAIQYKTELNANQINYDTQVSQSNATLTKLLRECYDRGGAPQALPYANGGKPFPKVSPWNGKETVPLVTPAPLEKQP